jgi:hypothetical protein
MGSRFAQLRLGMTRSLTPIAPSIADPVPLSAEVHTFCASRGLLAFVSSIVALAQTCFDLAEPLSFSMGCDPDSGEQWLDVVATARGAVPEVRKAYAEFTCRWLASMPPPVQDHVRLVLLAE